MCIHDFITTYCARAIQLARKMRFQVTRFFLGKYVANLSKSALPGIVHLPRATNGKTNRFPNLLPSAAARRIREKQTLPKKIS